MEEQQVSDVDSGKQGTSLTLPSEGPTGHPLVSEPGVLDRVQLTRIEGVHRGFLYQHLFAVGCLLRMAKMGVERIRVETDEDVELYWPDGVLYVQVKTRSVPLQRSDLASTLERFDRLRAEHASGRRKGHAGFLVTSNVGPSAALSKDIRNWPDDVHYRAPGFEHGQLETVRPHLPPACEDVSASYNWCAGEAGDIPGGLLRPETLVAKLAATMQQAASGTPPHATHEFQLAALAELFEQVVLELHDLPAPPSPYRPQEGEPDIGLEAPVQLVVGVSGSGKTSWAVQQAVHYEGTVAYFDAVGSSPGSVPAALVRELASRVLAGDRESLATVLLPGGGGTDSLRALGRLVERKGLNVLVVVDNAQDVVADEQVAIAHAAPSLRFIFLAQPGVATSAVAARLEVEPIRLRGWGLPAIAAECSSRGVPIDARTAARVRGLTGGLPLYVRGAAAIAASEYGGDAAAFCTACEQNEHLGSAPQRALLARTFEAGTKLDRQASAVLSLATVPLDHEEALSLVSDTLRITRVEAASRLRVLVELGIVSQLQAGQVQLHDAFRMLANDAQAQLEPGTLQDSAHRLSAMLIDSISKEPDAKRALLTYRLLPLTGNVEELVELSNDEFFIEYGLEEEFRTLLEAFAADETQSAEDRFWAYDGLAFARLARSEYTVAEQHLLELEGLAELVPPGVQARARIAIKRISLAGRRGDLGEAARWYQSVDARGMTGLIVDYNYALALHDCDDEEHALSIAQRVCDQYLKQLGLTLTWLVGKSPRAVLDHLGERAQDRQMLKHLADSLHLVGVIRQRLGGNGALHWFNALKLYQVAEAPTSLVKVGQDIVDELINLLGDASEARRFMEEALLPAIREYNLLGHLVPVSAQYAVVLAYCGDFKGAARVFADIDEFRDSLPLWAQQELESQRRLIEDLSTGAVRLVPRPPGAPSQDSPRVTKVGRNAPCPCGSGQKYKRCHGAAY